MKIAVMYVYVPGERFAPRTEAFVNSYRSFYPGIDHDLIVLAKVRSLPARLPQIPAVAWDAVGEGGWDIGPFLRMSKFYVDYDRLVLLGAYSRILCHYWLRNLCMAGELASATGSYENRPHLRTNCISVHPRLLNGMGPITCKHDCHMFEHGPDNLFKRSLDVGVEGVVVGRDGVYGVRDWRLSRTYRLGDQANLICADNHTDRYASETHAMCAELERLAWP